MMRVSSGRPASLFEFWFGSRVLLLVAILITLTSGILTVMVIITNTALLFIAIVFVGLVILLATRQQYEWVAGIIVVVSVLIDWYQLIEFRFPIGATGIALIPVTVGLLAKLSHGSWSVSPRWLLWGLLLAFGIPPILSGVILSDSIVYYLTVIFTPSIMYILGALIGRDIIQVRLLLSILSGFGSLIAIHTIIAALTGTFLLTTQHITEYLASVNDFALTGSTTSRVGSFLGNPDWNGAFLAMMVFIPVGLSIASSSQLAKLFYLVEAALILLALFFTYTAGSWTSVAVGFIPLLLLAGRGFQRIWLPALICAAIAGIYYVLPVQSALFLHHLQDPTDAQLRLGAWETAIRVIIAHPLSGLGLGFHTYLLRAQPYRVPLQYRPLAHPHNAYLELAALAGLPVLILFLSLLGTALWLAFQNHRKADERYRPLLGGAIAAIVVFSINCVTINGWTVPPLANIAWLILGAISSPALQQLISSDSR